MPASLLDLGFSRTFDALPAVEEVEEIVASTGDFKRSVTAPASGNKKDRSQELATRVKQLRSSLPRSKEFQRFVTEPTCLQSDKASDFGYGMFSSDIDDELCSVGRLSDLVYGDFDDDVSSIGSLNLQMAGLSDCSLVVDFARRSRNAADQFCEDAFQNLIEEMANDIDDHYRDLAFQALEEDQVLDGIDDQDDDDDDQPYRVTGDSDDQLDHDYHQERVLDDSGRLDNGDDQLNSMEKRWEHGATTVSDAVKQCLNRNNMIFVGLIGAFLVARMHRQRFAA